VLVACGTLLAASVPAVMHLFWFFSYNLDLEEKREGLNWSDHKTLPLSEQGTLCVTGPNQVRQVLLSSGTLFFLYDQAQVFTVSVFLSIQHPVPIT